MTNLENKIKEIFDRHKLYYDYYCFNNEVIIYVECGDWKHDHLLLKDIMSKNNFVCVLVAEEPSDEDCYNAEYTFKYQG